MIVPIIIFSEITSLLFREMFIACEGYHLESALRHNVMTLMVKDDDAYKKRSAYHIEISLH